MENQNTTELRCDCGRLLFKKTTHGFEFKCNRCKRIHLIPFDKIGPDFEPLCPVDKYISQSQQQ